MTVQSLNWTDYCKRNVRGAVCYCHSILAPDNVNPHIALGFTPVCISSATDVTVISVINWISVRSVELTEYVLSKDETSTPTAARDHQHRSQPKFLPAAFPQPIKSLLRRTSVVLLRRCSRGWGELRRLPARRTGDRLSQQTKRIVLPEFTEVDTSKCQNRYNAGFQTLLKA